MKTFWFYFYVTAPGGDRDQPLHKLPWPNFFERKSTPEVWFAMARRVEKHWLHPWPEAALLCKAAFMELLASLYTHAHEQELRHADAGEEAAMQAKRWIESRVADPITLDEIAKPSPSASTTFYGFSGRRSASRRSATNAACACCTPGNSSTCATSPSRRSPKKVGYDSTSAFARAYDKSSARPPGLSGTYPRFASERERQLHFDTLIETAGRRATRQRSVPLNRNRTHRRTVAALKLERQGNQVDGRRRDRLILVSASTITISAPRRISCTTLYSAGCTLGMSMPTRAISRSASKRATSTLIPGWSPKNSGLEKCLSHPVRSNSRAPLAMRRS